MNPLLSFLKSALIVVAAAVSLRAADPKPYRHDSSQT